MWNIWTCHGTCKHLGKHHLSHCLDFISGHSLLPVLPGSLASQRNVCKGDSLWISRAERKPTTLLSLIILHLFSQLSITPSFLPPSLSPSHPLSSSSSVCETSKCSTAELCPSPKHCPLTKTINYGGWGGDSNGNAWGQESRSPAPMEVVCL